MYDELVVAELFLWFPTSGHLLLLLKGAVGCETR